MIKEYISSEQLDKRITELASEISRDYKDKEIQIICVLKGAAIFAVELSLKIENDLKIDFIEVSSYQGTESTGNIILNKDITSSIKGKDVIIVEDIIDTGRTLSYLKEYLLDKQPNSLKICTLIDKKARRVVDLDSDYNGFEIDDKFIVGFGLDLDEKYRNLPYIGIVE